MKSTSTQFGGLAMSQIFEVRVKPNAKENKILEQDGNKFKVAVTAPAQEGKANKELIKFLSKKLKARVEIVKGKTSSKKLLRVEND